MNIPQRILAMTSDDDRRFQGNIELWRRSCPREATLLSYVERPQHDSEGKKFSAADAKRWIQSLPLKTVKVVIIYGIAGGYGYRELLPWLKKNKDHHLVFFEDNINTLRTFFDTAVATDLLQNSQVHLHYFHDLADKDDHFEPLYWHFAMTPFVVTSCHNDDPVRLEEFRQKIAYDMAMRNALLDEYLKYGVGFYINFYQNVMELPKSFLGTGLFKKFAGVPAIICGAGPSLKKNSQLLGTLRDRALIFAGGSALNALNAAGFNPHFGAGVDPNPAQLERLMTSQGYGVPFFYRNRMNHAAFRKIHGAKLYVPGAGGYDTAEYFEEKLKIPGADEPIDEGHNVVNFCAEIAQAMGCNPIIFVGMDLAFTGMQQYASGVIVDPKVSHKKLTQVESDDALPILKKDIFGKPTQTLWKWVAESEWISNFAKRYPLTTVVNCTEGGLGFPQVPNRTLKEVSGEMMSIPYPLSMRVHGEIQNSRFDKSVTEKKVTKIMMDLRKSLVRVISDFNILKVEAERSLEKLRKGSKESLQTGRAALAETELVEEDGYTYVLDIFNEMYARMLSREGRILNLRKRSLAQKNIDLLNLSLKKYEFLHDVANVNVQIIDFARDNAKKMRKEESAVAKKSTIIKIQPLKRPQKAVMVPKGRPKDGHDLGSGCVVRVVVDDACFVAERFIEKKGERHGQCLLYYPNGKIKAECFYKDGVLDGPAWFYNDFGDLLAQYDYDKGCPQGVAVEYFPSGKIARIQRYNNGALDGPQEYFNEEGELKSVINYTEGKYKTSR